MAAPRSVGWARAARTGAWPVEERRPSRGAGLHPAKKTAERRRQLERRRRFSVLVVVPVLLMLGSIYLHTVSAGLGEKTANLEERIGRAEARSESLGVRVSELSAPGRIRALAEVDLRMKEPDGADFRVYGNDGEDGKEDGGEKITEESP